MLYLGIYFSRYTVTVHDSTVGFDLNMCALWWLQLLLKIQDHLEAIDLEKDLS